MVPIKLGHSHPKCFFFRALRWGARHKTSTATLACGMPPVKLAVSAPIPILRYSDSGGPKPPFRMLIADRKILVKVRSHARRSPVLHLLPSRIPDLRMFRTPNGFPLENFSPLPKSTWEREKEIKRTNVPAYLWVFTRICPYSSNPPVFIFSNPCTTW